MYEKFERLMKEKGVTPADVSKATGIGKRSYLILPYTPLYSLVRTLKFQGSEKSPKCLQSLGKRVFEKMGKKWAKK